MENRRRIALVGLTVAVLGGLAWLAWPPRQKEEPLYQGKPLEFWLTAYDGNYKVSHPKGPPPPTRGEADEAIRHIGTNAIPTLLRMLQQRDSKLETKIIGLLRKQHFIKIPYTPANPHFKAAHGLGVLGSAASNAVPRLIAIFNHDPSSFPQKAVPVILGHIGPAAAQAIPALLRGITHTNEIVRNNAIFALRRIHAEPNLLVPVLIKCLNDPDILVRGQAAYTLGALGKDAQSAVPALLELWRRERPGRVFVAVDGAGVGESREPRSFGLSVSALDVRAVTGDALKAIDPEAAAKAGVN